MASGSWRQSDVRCPYFKEDNGHDLIACEGSIPGTKSKSLFYRRADFRGHMDKFCCADYWNCPLCEAIDNKYKEDE